MRNRIESALLLDATDHLDDYRIHDLFAEAGWQIHPQLRLVAGARLSLLPGRYRFERDNRRTGQRTATTLRLKDDKQLNGRAALLWSPNDYSVVKLIWGTASQDTGDASFAALEQIQTLELNTTLTRERWMLSASLFENRIDNIARSIQVLDTATGDYLPVDDNSGRWRTRGLEVILDARPLPDLSLSASLTWQHTEDRASGIEPGYSPALLAKLRADYRRGSLTYAAYARYLDALNADWDFVTGPVQGVVSRIGERVPAYWDIGLNLRWQPRAEGAGPYAALNVSNLLDTDNRDPANELTDLDRGLIGPGRTLTVTLGYAF